MKIGLAYDLRKDYLEMGYSEEETAEFDSEATINALDETISGLGHGVARIGNIFELTRRLTIGERWDMVFNICEGLHGRSREAQVPALLEAFSVPYTFSDPVTLCLCHDKALAKRIVSAADIPTPEFMEVSSLEDLENWRTLQEIAFPLFAKPISEGTGKGITPLSIVRNRGELEIQCEALLRKFRQPVLVETYLPGREFTVGVLGTGESARAIGALEVKLSDKAEPGVYSYINKEECEERIVYDLVEEDDIAEEAMETALRAYLALGCRDAGRVDLRTDQNGRIHFLELNPLAGINPVHSDLPILCSKVGISYRDLLSKILDSAFKRQGKTAAFRFNELPAFVS
ncbi:MAG: D-alanine--D-alanine ligase [Nitrospinae bacterium]|nr:D-alanine--D-alanine ligase [Nitrospinota bacterium]